MKRKAPKKLTFLAAAAACAVMAFSGKMPDFIKLDKNTAPVVESVKSAIGGGKSDAKTTKRSVGGNAVEKPRKGNVGTEIPLSRNKNPERILKRSAYTVSFNRDTNQPNWVAWCLEADEVDGSVQRCKDFYEDEDIPEPHRVTTKDYTNSGYDRGHMAPAADMKFDAVAMRECFYMSNICPQTHDLNDGGWKKVETACRRWAEKYGKVYIACGPLFTKKKPKKIGRDHLVPVPDAFFKCVYCKVGNRHQTIAFVFRNNEKRQNMNDAALTVDEVEEMTGLDFFYMLPDKVETAVESTFDLKYWQ